MIGVMVENRKGAVDLLAQYDFGNLVPHGERAQGEAHGALLQESFAKAIRPSDEKANVLLFLPHYFCEFFGIEHFPRGGERDIVSALKIRLARGAIGERGFPLVCTFLRERDGFVENLYHFKTRIEGF